VLQGENQRFTPSNDVSVRWKMDVGVARLRPMLGEDLIIKWIDELLQLETNMNL
jgi:hypothetical protein